MNSGYNREIKMKYKPTKEDCVVIRKCAQMDAGYGQVEICPSTKYNTDDRSKSTHMNVLLVTNDDPEKVLSDPEYNWSDIDLYDNAYRWRDFTKGVELTEDGNGAFDFYVYAPLNMNKELQTNVTAYYKHGKLVRVDGVPNTRWSEGKWRHQTVAKENG